MSLQKQLLSNKRLWVRLLSLAIIVGVALLKPKFDEYMASGKSGDKPVAQVDAKSSTADSRSVASNANGDSELSLEDLLASVREDSDDVPPKSKASEAKPSQTSSASTAGNQAGTQQQSSGKSTSRDKSNPKTASESSSAKGTKTSAAGGKKTNPGGANATTSKTTKADAKPRLGKLSLIRGTRDEFRSTAGLMYVPGSADGHRLKHVLKHAKDNPSKPVHGVFDGDRDQILEWIDKAYLMGKNGEKGARKESQRDRMVYTANLNERVGYVGGQKGKRNGNKECRYLRLVVQNGTEVVTAYPADRM